MRTCLRDGQNDEDPKICIVETDRVSVELDVGWMIKRSWIGANFQDQLRQVLIGVEVHVNGRVALQKVSMLFKTYECDTVQTTIHQHRSFELVWGVMLQKFEE